AVQSPAVRRTQSRVRARPAAPSLALVLDHRLNGRRHRRLRHAAARHNNRICASTTLDGSAPTTAPNGGSFVLLSTLCRAAPASCPLPAAAGGGLGRHA